MADRFMFSYMKNLPQNESYVKVLEATAILKGAVLWWRSGAEHLWGKQHSISTVPANRTLPWSHAITFRLEKRESFVIDGRYFIKHYKSSRNFRIFCAHFFIPSKKIYSSRADLWSSLYLRFAPSRRGWQRGLEPSLHDRLSYEIWPSESEYQISFHTNMADNDIEGKRLFPYLKPFLDSET